MELIALRFLSLNINSCVCLGFRCSEFGKGTNGGGKTDSNRVLISYAQSMYSLPFCLFLFSVSLYVSQASLPPSISISMCIVFLSLCVSYFSLSLSLLLSSFPHRLSISISVYPFVLIGYFLFIYNDRLLNGV